MLSLIANANIGSLKSLHTLFDTYLEYIPVEFETNYMVQNVQNFEFFDKKNRAFKQIFDKSLTPFYKTFLQVKQLFNGKLLIFNLPKDSKNYGSPTRAIRKVAPNMTYTTSMKHSTSSLNLKLQMGRQSD